MEKEKSAVEWLIEQLEEKGSASENVSIRRLQISIDVSEYLDLKRKAKEMEKEQRKKERVEAYNNGYANGQNDAYAI